MAVDHDQQLDKIFQALGPNGRFIKLQLFLTWIGTIPAGLQLLSNVFIGPEVPHRCARPPNETIFIDTYRGSSDSYRNVTVAYDQCDIRILSDETVIKKEKCLFGMEYDWPVDSSFTSQFDLVCDSTNLARMTQTLVICGQAFGALLGSLLSDRLGRKPVVIGAQTGLMITGLIIAYAPNFIVFSVFKFIVGAFQQATLTSVVNMMVELTMIKDRRLAATLGGIFWASGVIILDIIAFILKGQTWRTVQMVLSVATIPVFLEVCLLKESLRWLLANGKTKEATAYIKTAARMNGKTQEEILHALELMAQMDTDDDLPPKEEQARQAVEDGDDSTGPKSSKKMSYLDIFKNRRLFLNTCILWISWFTTAFGFFAIYLSSTALSGDRYLNFFLTALMELPSNAYFYFALNRYGRKHVVVVTFLTMSVGLIGSGIFRSLEQTSLFSGLSIAFNMVSMIGASGAFGILFFYTPELFPTNIRTQALGISSMMARIGGMLAPFTAILSDQAKWGPGVLIGCLACLVALLARFLPETNGRELPQTLEDMLSWFKKDNNEANKDVDDSYLLQTKNVDEEHKNGTNRVV